MCGSTVSDLSCPPPPFCEVKNLCHRSIEIVVIRVYKDWEKRPHVKGLIKAQF